jgi:3-oxoacyl-[acyl-carrier-protein] synthase III
LPSYFNKTIAYVPFKNSGIIMSHQILSLMIYRNVSTPMTEWIQERTGVQERRHIIPGEDTTTSMGVKAAEIAIKRALCCQRDIDFVVLPH